MGSAIRDGQRAEAMAAGGTFVPVLAQPQREWNNPASGQAVVAVVDENLGHAWPDWDLMGELWSFWQRMPPR